MDRNSPYDKEVLQSGLLVWNPLEKAGKWIGEKKGGYEFDCGGGVSRKGCTVTENM
jgi:hypothetical protein